MLEKFGTVTLGDFAQALRQSRAPARTHGAVLGWAAQLEDDSPSVERESQDEERQAVLQPGSLLPAEPEARRGLHRRGVLRSRLYLTQSAEYTLLGVEIFYFMMKFY